MAFWFNFLASERLQGLGHEPIVCWNMYWNQRCVTNGWYCVWVIILAQYAQKVFNSEAINSSESVSAIWPCRISSLHHQLQLSVAACYIFKNILPLGTQTCPYFKTFLASLLKWHWNKKLNSNKYPELLRKKDTANVWNKTPHQTRCAAWERAQNGHPLSRETTMWGLFNVFHQRRGGTPSRLFTVFNFESRTCT